MLTAAKPYAVLSSTANGELFAQVKAVPPSQPDVTSGSVKVFPEASQVKTGWETDAWNDAYGCQSADSIRQERM